MIQCLSDSLSLNGSITWQDYLTQHCKVMGTQNGVTHYRDSNASYIVVCNMVHAEYGNGLALFHEMVTRKKDVSTIV